MISIMSSRAHRQHLVGFIENQRAHAVEAERAAADVVEHAARGTGDDVATSLKRIDLLYPSARRRRPRSGDVAIGDQAAHFVCDLQRKLTRGDQHQGLDAAVLAGDGGIDQTLREGQAEGRGLARASASLNDQVATRQHRSEGASLNLRRRLVAHLGDGSQYLGP